MSIIDWSSDVCSSDLAQRVIGLTVLSAVTVVSVLLLIEVDRDGTIATQAGGWSAPMGITLVADRLTANMLTVGSVLLPSVLVYAIGHPGAARNHVCFHSVSLVLAAAVAGSFSLGPMFYMCSAFVLLSTASYLLLPPGRVPGA